MYAEVDAKAYEDVLLKQVHSWAVRRGRSILQGSLGLCRGRCVENGKRRNEEEGVDESIAASVGIALLLGRG